MRVPPHPVEPGDTLAIFSTSGTTGLSKGVCCPHAQYFWWGVYTSRLLGIGENDVLLTTLPLFHTNATEQLLSGAPQRSGAHRRAAFLGVGIHAGAGAARGPA